MSSAIDLTNCNYVAWALNTGPANVVPLWQDSRWIAGEWTGANGSLKEEQIRKDIDTRVECLVGAFKAAREQLSDAQKQRALSLFVTPEFYYHAKEGPYPNVRISGLPPFDYLRSTLKAALAKISLLPAESWLLLAGSMLSCSEDLFEEVLRSNEARTRLAALNKALHGLAAERGIRSAADLKGPGPHIKGLSYSKHSLNLKPAEQALDALMNEFRADPLCVVRNRGLAFTLSAKGVDGTGYEKQNESTVDLTMGKLVGSGSELKLDPAGMITEWIAGYPSISTINGDKQVPATPLAARYTVTALPVSPLQIGIEICLDHRLKRLRRTVSMTVARGATADNPPLDLQLVPSGGMQILDYSVSAGTSGVIFNGDGCDPILDVYTADGKPVIKGSGTFKQITAGVYASSAQTLVEQGTEQYYSHSQLSFRWGGEMGSYDNARGTDNANGATFTGNPPTNPALDGYPPARRIPVQLRASDLFAAGYGELHVYSKPVEAQG